MKTKQRLLYDPADKRRRHTLRESRTIKSMPSEDDLRIKVPVEDAMRAANAIREKFTFSDPPDEEPRKQFCLSCGATHWKEICPYCGSDAQDDL